MVKKIVGWPLLGYGVLLLYLGYMGWQSGSQISLYIGMVAGILLCVSAIHVFQHKHSGFWLALWTNLGLTAGFGYRYNTTGKSLTAILTLISAALFFYLVVHAVHWHKTKR